MDYQMAYEGGNGYLGLLEFDLTNNRIGLLTGSPWVVSKPRETLTSYDQPILEGPRQQYAIDLDFAERFAGFNPTFAAGTADQQCRLQTALALPLEGCGGPAPRPPPQPGTEPDT